MYHHIVAVVLSSVMVISSVLLTYRWFAVVHKNVDFYVVLFSFLLTTSLGLLLLDVLYVMRKTVEEVESSKRVISIGYREIEERIEKALQRGIREIEQEIDEIRRRFYR